MKKPQFDLPRLGSDVRRMHCCPCHVLQEEYMDSSTLEVRVKEVARRHMPRATANGGTNSSNGVPQQRCDRPGGSGIGMGASLSGGGTVPNPVGFGSTGLGFVSTTDGAPDASTCTSKKRSYAAFSGNALLTGDMPRTLSGMVPMSALGVPVVKKGSGWEGRDGCL